MTDRIILDEKVSVGKELFLEGPPLEALRFQGARAGSIVTLTDTDGNDFRGRVVHLSGEEASILIFDLFPSSTESPLEIILLQALPEKERMELIIQKATELGVSAILPFKSDRSISLKERESKQKKAQRWQHIAIKAVQQSRRARVPLVENYSSFLEALEFCKEEGLKIVLWEKKGENLKSVLKRYSTCNPLSSSDTNPPSPSINNLHSPRFTYSPLPLSSPFRNNPSLPPFAKGGVGGFEHHPPFRIYAMVGPEGGFTEDEVKLAQEYGFIPVKLGQRIMRTETAAITLIGILQFELGDLG